jgi:hypothetical protein
MVVDSGGGVVVGCGWGIERWVVVWVVMAVSAVAVVESQVHTALQRV